MANENAAPAAAAAAAAPAGPSNATLLDPSHDNTKAGGAGGSDPNANAEGKKPDAGAPDPAKEKAGAAPEKYADYTFPDGVKAEPAVVAEFNTVAKELNLTQEAAQKLVDFQSKAALAQVQQIDAEAKKVQAEWETKIKKDLGVNYDTERSFAAKGRDWNSDPELMDLLNKSGLGSHPAVFKHFAKLGKAVAEDSLTEGKPAGSGGESALKPTSEVLFGKTTPQK